ncbi:unnamed protein product, partial [Mesorhabditis spiculigera]
MEMTAEEALVQARDAWHYISKNLDEVLRNEEAFYDVENIAGHPNARISIMALKDMREKAEAYLRETLCELDDFISLYANEYHWEDMLREAKHGTRELIKRLDAAIAFRMATKDQEQAALNEQLSSGLVNLRIGMKRPASWCFPQQ